MSLHTLLFLRRFLSLILITITSLLIITPLFRHWYWCHAACRIHDWITLLSSAFAITLTLPLPFWSCHYACLSSLILLFLFFSLQLFFMPLFFLFSLPLRCHYAWWYAAITPYDWFSPFSIIFLWPLIAAFITTIIFRHYRYADTLYYYTLPHYAFIHYYSPLIFCRCHYIILHIRFLIIFAIAIDDTQLLILLPCFSWYH